MRRDTIVSGSLAGLLGNLPKTAITWILHALGHTRYTFEHIAAGYFVPKEYLDRPVALATGFIGDYTPAGLLGVAMYLILVFSGTDYALIKGAGLGAVTYIFFFGMAMAIDITRASLLTPLPNLLLLFPNVIFGITTAWILKNYILNAKQTNEFRLETIPHDNSHTNDAEEKERNNLCSLPSLGGFFRRRFDGLITGLASS